MPTHKVLNKQAVASFLLVALKDVLQEEGHVDIFVDENSPLTGVDSVIDSYARILFLVKAEDACLERGIPFNFYADASVSAENHPLCSIGTLAAYLAAHALTAEDEKTGGIQ